MMTELAEYARLSNTRKQTKMEASETENDKQPSRLLKFLNEIEKRVELMREQAQEVQKEKENLLELLQDLQDGSMIEELSKVDQEDIECDTERLIIRCLTVDVSVATPRNENQEDAFKTVSKIIEELNLEVKRFPKENQRTVESYLNACLPEPINANINQRFQDKLLGCTAEDQKAVRRKLQHMLDDLEKLELCNGDDKTNVNSES